MDTPRKYGDHSDMVEVKVMTTVDGAPRLLTVEEFDKMVAGDVFDEDERLELVEGAIVSYAPPQGDEHAYAVWHFPEVIRERLGGRVVLWMQNPVIVSNMTVLEPDLTLLRPREDRYRRRPGPADVLAVVEIAVSSLARDRSDKLRLYAEAGIKEYWIVDVFGRCIEVFRQPLDAEFAISRAVTGVDSIAFEVFPDDVFTVAELLG